MSNSLDYVVESKWGRRLKQENAENIAEAFGELAKLEEISRSKQIQVI